MDRGSGFGKTILIGDAFIQFGVPAIVSAIASKTIAIVEVTSGTAWEVEDNRPEIPGYKASKLKQRDESIERILRVMNIDFKNQRIRIKFEGDLLAGSGIGASAASCVALVRALNSQFSLALDDQAINNIAFEGEKGYHGEPGGIDNTASTYGGILSFQKDLANQRDLVERLTVREPINLVLANSGISVNTAKVVEYKKTQVKKYPEKYIKIFAKMTDQAKELRAALSRFDLGMVGKIMNEHHGILHGLNFSHEQIEVLINIASKQGALGAKLTGGGMGGYMVALTSNADQRERVAQAIEEKGFRTLQVSIGP